MTTSTLDIIVPVWNHPTEARACLVSILDCAETARLIIINNGCDRATELMLEEFSDHLGDRAIYMTMERNIGFVPAVNRALNRSDADWAVIVRPTGTLTAECYQQILEATTKEQAGIITPHCPSEHPLPARLLKSDCSCLETCNISFALLALSRSMRSTIGLFDEELDGGTWCLQDYRHRADAHGFRSYLLPKVAASGEPITIFGSRDRRRKQEETAINTFRQRWGTQQQLALYLPKESDEHKLKETLQLLHAAARHGHRLELFLHRRQYTQAIQNGAACLHSGIVLHKLPLLTPLKSLARSMEKLKLQHPQLQPVCSLDDVPFPGYDNALPITLLQQLAKP